MCKNPKSYSCLFFSFFFSKRLYITEYICDITFSVLTRLGYCLFYFLSLASLSYGCGRRGNESKNEPALSTVS